MQMVHRIVAVYRLYTEHSSFFFFASMGISAVDLFLYCETDIDIIIDQASVFSNVVGNFLVSLQAINRHFWVGRSFCWWPYGPFFL